SPLLWCRLFGSVHRLVKKLVCGSAAEGAGMVYVDDLGWIVPKSRASPDRRVMVSQLEKLTGRLTWLMQITPRLKAAMAPFYALQAAARKHALRHVTLGSSICQSCRLFLNVLASPRLTGTTASQLLGWAATIEDRCSVVVTDASLQGIGGVVFDLDAPSTDVSVENVEWFCKEYSQSTELSQFTTRSPPTSADICSLELIAAGVATTRALTRKPDLVIVLSDNTPTVHALRRNSASAQSMKSILRSFNALWPVGGFVVTAYHIRGDNNSLADFLSRSDRSTILHTVQHLGAEFDAAPILRTFQRALMTSVERLGGQVAGVPKDYSAFLVSKQSKTILYNITYSDDPGVADEELVRLTLQSAKRILRNRKQKRTVTLTLEQVKQVMLLNPPSGRTVSVVAFLTGIFCLLRLKEVVSLSPTDITQSACGAYLKVHIRSSKTDQSGSGQTVILGCSHGKPYCEPCEDGICAMHRIAEVLDKGPNEASKPTLFGLSYSQLSKDINALVENVFKDTDPEIEVGRKTSHSMRRTGVCLLADAKVPLHEIA
ncbi:hypothetical protein FOZ62_001042, partial [Perkinsus olseni]